MGAAAMLAPYDCPDSWTEGMKLTGLSLLAAGWIIVLASVALLPLDPARVVFVLAGIGVEIMGGFFLVRSHAALPRERG